MAVTAKIFLLLIGVVIVKSHHLHHFHNPHHHHHHHGIHGFFDRLFHPGLFGVGLFGSDNNMFGNGDSVQDEYVDGVYPDENMGQEENHAPFDIGTGYEDYDLDIGVNHPDQNNVMIEQPNESNPDVNLNIDVAEQPQTADDHDSNNHEPEAPKITVEIKPDEEPETDDQSNQVDNNRPHLNIATDNVAGQNMNTSAALNTAVGNGALSGLTQQNNPEKTNNDSINNKVPGFLDEDIKKGIVMVDPELKYNINEVNTPRVSVDAGLDLTVANNAEKTLNSQNNPEDKKVDSIGNVKTVPELNDDDIKKGMLMVDPELKYNINEGHEPIVPDMKESISQNNPSITTENADELIGYEEPGFIGNKVNKDTSTDEPKLSHNILDESQISITLKPVHKETVPGFNDEEIKKGILMIDPEVKLNDTDKGLDKYSDAVVFPDEVTELKQQNQANVQQNLPDRFSTGDNTNQYPSVTASVLTATVQPSNTNIQGQWITPIDIAQTSNNNQGTLNQPSNLAFVQNPNQQVPVNNGNGYVHVVRNQNGDYTVVNVPNNNGSPSQASISGNSGINNPGQYYVLLKNPDQAYVNTANGNSGVIQPGQVYVSGNSGINNPSQVYVTGSSGASTPGQIYVSNNVPSSGTQAVNGGYYNVIQLNNGQTAYVPVNNDQNYGNGQNTQWNGQSNNGQIYYVPVDYNQGQGYQVLGNNPTGTVSLGNQMNGGSTSNVPLLISYKDKDGEDEEKSESSDSQKGEKEE